MTGRVVHIINTILVALGVAFIAYVIAPVEGSRDRARAELLFALISLAIGCGAGFYWCRTRSPVRRPFPPGHCRKCGYNLTGNVSGRCPECGARSLVNERTPAGVRFPESAGQDTEPRTRELHDQSRRE
jgi:DNA-directed RNA polymerase subunit RPC12/RpoP